MGPFGISGTSTTWGKSWRRAILLCIRPTMRGFPMCLILQAHPCTPAGRCSCQNVLPPMIFLPFPYAPVQHRTMPASFPWPGPGHPRPVWQSQSRSPPRKKFPQVVGFDLNAEKINLYKSGVDPTNEVGDEVIRNTKLEFTADASKLREAKFHIVAARRCTLSPGLIRSGE
mgnify:CR=1 FL=1